MTEQEKLQALQEENMRLHDELAAYDTDIKIVARFFKDVQAELGISFKEFSIANMGAVLPGVMGKLMSGQIDASKFDMAGISAIGEKYQHLINE